MDPRQLWERHAVLAEAFCGTDERVRATKAVLDTAQQERARTLAAFAVTVGDDDAVAQMLGLTEREVRVARRGVGKEAARACAEALLSAAQREDAPTAAHDAAADPSAAPAAPAAPARQAGPRSRPRAGRPSGGQPAAAPGPTTGAPAPGRGPAAPGSRPPHWSPALDAVLAAAWQTQHGFTVPAAELGMDIGVLTARARQLSADGRQRAAAAADQEAGRHRRGTEGGPYPPRDAPPEPPRPPSPSPASPFAPAGEGLPPRLWQRSADPARDLGATATAAHDWDGILNRWQAAQPAV